MIYLDTSFIIPTLVQEATSDKVVEWLDRQGNGTLVTSAWADTEVSSALSLKVRTTQISVEERAKALSVWQNMKSDIFRVVAVVPADFETASRFLDQVELGLRAGDALHLAIAASNKLVLVTFDNRMAAAAAYYGIVVDPL